MKSFVTVFLALAAVAQASTDFYHPVKVQFGQGRIVGGNEATPHSYPYQVGIFLSNIYVDKYFCGGSLLTTKIVLTAAHCVDGYKTLEVVLGAHRIQQFEDTQIRIFATDYVIHEDWNRATFSNDIALVNLPEEVELNDYHPEPMNTMISRVKPGKTVTISGWGKDSDSSNSISPVLREVSTPVMSNLICSPFYPFVIKSTHLCASGAGGKSACNGDSGGPLVVKSAGSIQVGIVSFGMEYCERGYPAVYTRVTEYLDWIETHAGITID